MQAIWAEWRAFYETNLRLRDPKDELADHLRILYGRGEITRENFFRLRFRLDWGQIGQGDLILLHQDALRKKEAQGKIPMEEVNSDTGRGLDRLYLDRVLVEEARFEFEANQQSLAQELAWIKEQAESARQSARAALPNEDEARTYLAVWQDLLELSRTIEQRREGLAQQLSQMNGLEAEIRAAIAKLKLLQSQEHLMELNLRIRQDLIAQGEKR